MCSLGREPRCPRTCPSDFPSAPGCRNHTIVRKARIVGHTDASVITKAFQDFIHTIVDDLMVRALLAYVRSNSGQRGEQITDALGSDGATMRPVMNRLIEERRIKTKCERRGMACFAT